MSQHQPFATTSQYTFTSQPVSQNLPRLPNPYYLEQSANGFQVERAQFTESNMLGSDDMSGPQLETALDQWRYGQFVLKHKKRKLPDFETMKAEVEKPSTGEDVKKRLGELEQEHLQDLQRLYEMQAEEYLQEVHDVYFSRDESQYKVKDGEEQTEAQKALETFLDGSMRPHIISQRWFSDHSQLRYIHLRRAHDIQSAERLRMRTFPADVDDFRSRPKDVQVRVARFLVADKSRQERYLSEFKWAWRQAQPLVECFRKDESFSSEIRAMVLSADHTVKDPRQRPA